MKKIIICFAILLCTVTATAVNLGDKVVLSSEAKRFETGERIKKDCLGKEYTVLQVGTKEFPTGVLLKEIYSWVKYTDVGMSDEEFEDTKKRFASDNMQLKYKETIVKTDTVFQIVKDTLLQTVSDTIVKVVTERVVVYDTIYTEKLLVKTDTINLSNTEAFNRFSIGARAGAAAYIAETSLCKWNLGYQAALDLQYAHYFKRKTENNPYCGVLTGVSVSYVSSSVSGSVNDAYSVMDTEGDQIDYTITAEQVKSSMSELQLQVPLMFSLLYKGLYFNIGPRFVVPVYTQGHQTLTNAHITAYYAPYGVTLTDAVITGKLSEEQLDAQVSWDSPVFQINASAEIGYEFALKNGDSFGIGVYADYGIYNLYKSNASAQSMISISQVGAEPLYPVPTVEVLPMVSTYVSKLGYFDTGIKLVYNFNVR